MIAKLYGPKISGTSIQIFCKDPVDPTTHAMTMNGRISGEVKDPFLSATGLIEQRLTLLDGVTRFSLSLWRLPDGIPFDRVDLATWPVEYVQVAGSRERLILEAQRLEQGIPVKYVVGRNTIDASASPAGVVVPWNGCETRVLSSEVFTASEAAEVFAFYYNTGELPDFVSVRRPRL